MGMEKVHFLIHQPPSAEFYEGLHAKPVGPDLYLLDNSPLFAYGVSFMDVVYAPVRDGRALYDSTHRRGGHSTYRVKLAKFIDHDAFLQKWPRFANFGCTYEGTLDGSRRLYAIDVPPSCDLVSVYRYLQDGEASGWWVFEEADYCPETIRQLISKSGDLEH